MIQRMYHRVRSCSIAILLLNASIPILTRCGRSDDSLGLRFLGFVQPKGSADIAGSPWGLQYGTMDPAMLDRAAAIGVK